MYTDHFNNWDIEYSPSWNTKRFQNTPKPYETVLEHFVSTLSAQTKEAQSKYLVRKDVRYGGEDDNQLLDIYSRHNRTDTSDPLFVYIHGGYWQYLDKSTSGSFVEPLVENGYEVIAVDYNLCRKSHVTLEHLWNQMHNFFAWLYDYSSKKNSPSICIAGHSAGAHLVTILLTDKLKTIDNISSIFLISGIFDLRELWPLQCVNPDNVLGLDANNVEYLSPMCWPLQSFYSKKAQFYILVAEHDSATFKGQSERFAEKLKQSNFNVSFKIFDKYDHFDIIEEVPLDQSPINSYIIQSLDINNAALGKSK